MERDIDQKMKAVKLFWYMEYLPIIDVKLFNPSGVSKKKIDITDIDVLGLKVNDNLIQERVSADCKTQKNTSPINRAFWLSGLMQSFGISKGYLILSKLAPGDHKIAANKLNITVTSDEEFDLLSSKLIRNIAIEKMSLVNPEIWSKYHTGLKEVKDLVRVKNYIEYQYWHDSHQRQIRYTLMETRSGCREIKQKSWITTSLYLDVLSLFSHSLTLMISTLFNTYSSIDDKAELSEALKAYVYDGRDNYEHLNRLTSTVRLLKVKIESQTDLSEVTENLSLPGWNQFIQLVKTGLENPQSFKKVPLIFKYLMFEKHLSNSEVPLDKVLDYDEISLKLTLETLSYFNFATNCPLYIYETIQKELEQILVK